MRKILRGLSLVLMFVATLAGGELAAQTANRNTTAFPLSSNVLFPAQSQRQTLRCYNATTNDAATVIYPSGFAVVLQPGAPLWETGSRVPTGQFTATGTAGQTLDCVETY